MLEDFLYTTLRPDLDARGIATKIGAWLRPQVNEWLIDHNRELWEGASIDYVGPYPWAKVNHQLEWAEMIGISAKEVLENVFPSGLTCVRADGCAGANADAGSDPGAAAAQLGR